MNLPQIKNDKDAEIWKKELGKVKKEDLIGMMTRVLAAHPEAAEWIQNEMSADASSHQKIYADAEEKRKVKAAVQELWKKWKVVREWADRTERHYGLDYDEEDEAYSDGWRFQRYLKEHSEITWETKMNFMEEMIEVSEYDTDYLDWGDILYCSATAMINTRDEFDRFTKLVVTGKLEGDFVETVCEILKRDFAEK